MSNRFSATVMPRRSNGRSAPGRIWSKVCRLTRADDGVSAIEFALLAPMLVLALLATVDVGLALTERMTIDHVLRAGAQSATAGVDVAAIDQVLRTTAANNFTLAAPGATGDDSALALTVSRVCACAEQPGTAVACSTTCAGSASTQIFYDLAGQKTYSGIILPRFGLSPALQVQVR